MDYYSLFQGIKNAYYVTGRAIVVYGDTALVIQSLVISCIRCDCIIVIYTYGCGNEYRYDVIIK